MRASQAPRRARLFEVLRFGFSGLLTNVAYFAVLFAMLWLELPVELSGAVAYACSMVVNYVLQARYTFRSDRTLRESTLPYLATHGIGMAINSASLHLLVSRLQWPVLAGQAIALVLVASWSYLAMKRWVFAKRGR